MGGGIRLLAVLWALSGAAAAAAQAPPQSGEFSREAREFLLLPSGSTPVRLRHSWVDPASLRVSVDGRPWQAGSDYQLQSRTGVLIPLRSWLETTAADSLDARAVVVLRYRFLPVTVPTRLDLRPVAEPPAAERDRSGGLFAAPATPDAWQTGQLRVSGSKTVQVSSGSRREMTVDQNLRLDISGSLTGDITVRAFLSDDNLPVVPEGNTEELRDIDKVLVELTAPRWRSTLGDFVARREGSAFGNYRRKLQGISVTAEPGPATAEVLAGSPRGLYRTLQIRGQESNQGPYYLGGGSAGQNLFIVAGSERVALDGLALVRGADRDYVIDYVRGTVTFTFRRLITAESNIVVEFEEGEGAYSRTVTGAGAGLGFTLPGIGTAGRFQARIIRERDDPNRLRTGELDPADEALLAAAGDDPALAVAPGVIPVEPGSGLYTATIIDGRTAYVYAETGGDFDLILHYVGGGLGQYDLLRLTAEGRQVFVYRGPGLGAYLLGRPLDLPESRSVASLSAGLGDSTGAYLAGEWHASDHDRNQLSDRGDGDNAGTAGRLSAGTGRRALGRGLGTLDVGGFYESRAARFRPFEVRKTLFHYDAWGLEQRARRPGFLDEGDIETGLDAAWTLAGPRRSLVVKGDWGSLRHGAALTADRRSGTVEWTLAGGQGSHLLQRAGARDPQDLLDIERLHRRHRLAWRLGPVVPSLQTTLRRWIDAAAGGGAAAGFRLRETATGLASGGGGPAWRLEFQRGLADSLAGGGWRLQRDTRTYLASLSTGKWAGMRLVGEGTLRRILQSDGPDQSTRLARLTVSGTWEEAQSDWTLGYRVDNSRSEVLTRQILFVGESQGDYSLVQAGTDSLVATTAVQADLHWRQGFGFLGAERWTGAWSALTTATVTGRSTTDRVGRLLALDPAVIFDRRETVLGEVSLAEELTLLQHDRRFDLRPRFDFRQARDRQYADHPEDRIQRGWQTTANATVSGRSSLKARWQRLDERRYSAESSLSARRSYSALTRRWELGWLLRPASDWRLGLQAEVVRRRDAVSDVSQRETALRPEARVRLRRSWTLSGEVRLAEVASDEPVGAQRPWFFPYPGRNVDSSLRLAWDPSQYLGVSLSWFTRKQGDRRWQHDVRLESTARF